MQSIFLQKSSKASKSEDDLRVLDRRINLWKLCEIYEFLFEDKTMQQRLKTSDTPKELANYL